MSPLVSTFAGAALRPYGFSVGGGAPAGAYELISTTSLGSTASSVTFSSIASTYSHLQIRFALATSSAGYAGKLTVNGATTNYSGHIMAAWVSGGTPTMYSQGDFGEIYYHTINTGAAAAPQFTTGIIDILDYADTNKYKSVTCIAGVAGSSQKEITMFTGAWRQNTAISSVTLAVVGANTYTAGSRFSLYGIKAA